MNLQKIFLIQVSNFQNNLRFLKIQEKREKMKKDFRLPDQMAWRSKFNKLSSQKIIHKRLFWRKCLFRSKNFTTAAVFGQMDAARPQGQWKTLKTSFQPKDTKRPKEERKFVQSPILFPPKHWFEVFLLYALANWI